MILRLDPGPLDQGARIGNEAGHGAADVAKLKIN